MMMSSYYHTIVKEDVEREMDETEERKEEEKEIEDFKKTKVNMISIFLSH